MDEEMRGSSTASFGQTHSSLATGESTNVAMVGLAGSAGQASSGEKSPSASSGSALATARPMGVPQRIEETPASDRATNGHQDASGFPIPTSISDAGSTGGDVSRSVAPSNQFEALGDRRPRSRSPSAGQLTPKKTSGCGTPGQVVYSRGSGRSTGRCRSRFEPWRQNYWCSGC